MLDDEMPLAMARSGVREMTDSRQAGYNGSWRANDLPDPAPAAESFWAWPLPGAAAGPAGSVTRPACRSEQAGVIGVIEMGQAAQHLVVVEDTRQTPADTGDPALPTAGVALITGGREVGVLPGEGQRFAGNPGPAPRRCEA